MDLASMNLAPSKSNEEISEKLGNSSKISSKLAGKLKSKNLLNSKGELNDKFLKLLKGFDNKEKLKLKNSKLKPEDEELALLMISDNKSQSKNANFIVSKKDDIKNLSKNIADLSKMTAKVETEIKLDNSKMLIDEKSEDKKVIQKNLGNRIFKNLSIEEKKELTKLVEEKLETVKDGLKSDTKVELKKSNFENELAVSKRDKSKATSMSSGKNSLSVAHKNELTKDSKISNLDLKNVDEKAEFVKTKSYGLKRIKPKDGGIDFEKNFQDILINTKNSSKDIGLSNVKFGNSVVKPQYDYDFIMNQINNGVKINYNNQIKEMKIRLQPEELGEVEVKLNIENNLMKAEFIVDSEIVKAALEAKFNSLKENLLSKGINASEINVVLADGGDKKGGNNFKDEMNKIVKNERNKTKIVNSEIEILDKAIKTNKVNSSEGLNILV